MDHARLAARACCEDMVPPLRDIASGRWIACHIPLETLRREPPVRARARAAEVG